MCFFLYPFIHLIIICRTLFRNPHFFLPFPVPRDVPFASWSPSPAFLSAGEIHDVSLLRTSTPTEPNPTISMPYFRIPSVPLPSLRYRNRQPFRAASTSTASPSIPQQQQQPRRAWPSPYAVLRGPAFLVRQGPRMLLRAPGAVLRAPGSVRARTQRLFSSTRLRRSEKPKPAEGESGTAEEGASFTCESVALSPLRSPPLSCIRPKNWTLPHQRRRKVVIETLTQSSVFFPARLKQRLSTTPTVWYPIPLSLGVAVLVLVNFYKQRSWEKQDESKPVPESEIKVKGPWQVRLAIAFQSLPPMLMLAASCSPRFTSSEPFLFDPFRAFTGCSIRTPYPFGFEFLATSSTPSYLE